MKTRMMWFLRRALRSEDAQILPLVAVLMIAFLGMAALVLDVGDIYYSHHELQAGTNAAAMAAAEGLSNSGTLALQQAQAYNSQAGGKNYFANLNVTSYSATLGCVTATVGASTPCVDTGTGTMANAVQVKQTARVPLYFAALFGHSYMDITATGTALMRGSGAPYNIAIILDTTGSMNTKDTNCGKTRLQCAFDGVQTLLANISPCGSNGCQGAASNTSNYSNAYDRVSLFTFPNGHTGVMSNSYNCSGLPADELVPERGQRVSNYSNAVPYVLPAIGGSLGTIAYNVPGKGGAVTTYNVTYQVTNGLGDANGFMSNYQGDSGLNTGSNLVMALGGKSGCASMQAPYIDGTYYAGAIYQAQSALTAEQAAYPLSQNVMIIVGDGDSNVSQNYVDNYNSMVTKSSQTNGLIPQASPSASNNYYPALTNDCGQAILAAQYAKAMGTTVYTVAYGSPTGGARSSENGCSTDTSGVSLGTEGVSGNSTGLSGSSKNISPCTTMKYMASNDGTFYSDYKQSGHKSECVASTTGAFTSLSTIFRVIAGSLSVSRLIPNSTFPTT